MILSDTAIVAPTIAPAATPTPIPTPATGVMPMPADALVDSMGLNASVANLYMRSDFQNLVALAQVLGVRHVRSAILDHDASYDTPLNQVLTAANAKLDGVSDCAGLNSNAASETGASDIQAFNTAINNRLETVEGPNEVDDRNDSNYVADTQACLPAVSGALPIPFVAPSLADPGDDAPTLGNLSAYANFGNSHRYFDGNNPGTAGFGALTPCGYYGALKWAICEAQITVPNKPVMVTETGWNSDSEVDLVTQGKYVSRVFLVNYQIGIPRTYVYSLTSYTGGDGFGGDGLLDVNDNAKPAFSAMASEIALFSDPGPTYSGAPVNYTVTGGAPDSMLFAKRDGSYIIALWYETESWNPTLKTPISVPPTQISINFATKPATLTTQAFNDGGNLQAAAGTFAGNSYTVGVDDHVTFVSFHP